MTRRLTAATLALVMVLSAAGAASGRMDLTGEEYMGAGFSSSVPDQWVGATVFQTRPAGVGFYMEFKGDPLLPVFDDDHYMSLTSAETDAWGHDLTGERKSALYSVCVGVTRVVSKHMAVYVALGYGGTEEYDNYYDPDEVLGTEGSYWLTSEDTSHRVTGATGVLVTLNKFIGAQLGVDVNPGSVTFGLFTIQ